VLLLAAGALVLMVRADRLSGVVGGIGLAAVIFLAAALAGRFEGLLPWALVLAGAAYAAFLVIRGSTIDAYAPIYGAGLLLVAELAYWSMEHRRASPPHEGLAVRRGTLVLAGCVGAGGVAGLILAMAELSISGGLWLEALGVAAAVGSVALLARLAREA
jgi:hypothetical protein